VDAGSNPIRKYICISRNLYVFSKFSSGNILSGRVIILCISKKISFDVRKQKFEERKKVQAFGLSGAAYSSMMDREELLKEIERLLENKESLD